MKTIIDAVNELRGDTGNLKRGNTVSIVYSKTFGFSDYWEASDTALSGTCWQFVCTAEEFNAMVAEISEGFEEYKREYEMNKVETVTVDGMVYEIGKLYEFSYDRVNWFADRLLSHVNGEFVGWSRNYNSIRLNSVDNGAITTELVDGKAYQFDYSGEGSAAGFYDKEKDSFRILSIEMESEYCTNIIPLVPEVK